MKKQIIKTLIFCTLCAFTACGTQKQVVNDGKSSAGTTEASMEKQKREFVRKVYDNATFSKNIVSKIDFTLNTGSQNISVGGSLHMRKDDVIRIQLFVPIIGIEAGRLEFTKDYVMIVDRIHSEYIKADYNQVDFLKNNGLNFYSLQALFWNELFIPGKEKVTESALKTFDVDLRESATTSVVSLKKDHMNYQWLADNKTALISEANVSYSHPQNGTTSVQCRYDKFKPLGSKKFPSDIAINMNTNATQKARKVSVRLGLNSITTDSDWDPRTTVSSKYKEVSVEDVLRKIMSL